VKHILIRGVLIRLECEVAEIINNVMTNIISSVELSYAVYIIIFLLEIMLLTASLWKINIVDTKKIPLSSDKHLT